MLEKIKAMAERVLERWNGEEAQERGPIPPNRIATAAPQQAPAHSRPAPSTGAGKPDAATAAVAETKKARILSRGNGKNVYVVADEDADENELLRIIDTAEAPLSLVEEHGRDPYNSGVHRRQDVWS